MDYLYEFLAPVLTIVFFLYALIRIAGVIKRIFR